MSVSLLSYRVSVSPGAYAAEPLTATEIDAHPDRDRIWATILKMRNDLAGVDWSSRWEVGTRG